MTQLKTFESEEPSPRDSEACDTAMVIWQINVHSEIPKFTHRVYLSAEYASHKTVIIYIKSNNGLVFVKTRLFSVWWKPSF